MSQVSSMSAPTGSGPPARSRRAYGWLLVAVLLAAVAFRLWDFPAPHQVRDVDEIGYVQGSLALLEGITPGYAAAPGGTQFWIGWAYAASQTARNFLFPIGPAAHAPWELRAFYAVDRTLFDDYRNLAGLRAFEIAVMAAISVAAAGAACRLGYARAGVAGGVFAGLLVAASPLFVAYSCESRPYALSWSLGILAIVEAALGKGTRRIVVSAVLLGLAVASRIDMLCLVPLVLWEFWDRPAEMGLWRASLAVLGLSSVLCLAVSPWLATHMIGELRTIATVRFGPPPGGPVPLSKTLYQFAVCKGFAVAMLPFLIFFASAFFLQRGQRFRRLVLATYAAFLFVSMFRATGFGIHQQGAVVVAFILAGIWGLAWLRQRRPAWALALAVLSVALPLAVTTQAVDAQQAAYTPGHAVAWIDVHVPPGTRIYIKGMRLNFPLPTASASDHLWATVTDAQSWRRKFEEGLKRFGLKGKDLPRAMSEANMIQERGNRRGWFILGGERWRKAPRYDIRVVKGSPIFGVRHLEAAYGRTGGVVLMSATAPPPAWLGTPVAKWVNAAGIGTYIFERPPRLGNSAR